MENKTFENEPEIKDEYVECFLKFCSSDKYAQKEPYESPLFEVISPRTLIQILINREWKSNNCKNKCITDLENLVYKETGLSTAGYIEMLCGYATYDYSDFGKELKESIKKMDHVPFPSKDISIDQLKKIIENGTLNLSKDTKDTGKQ